MPDHAGLAVLADLCWTIRQAGSRMDRVNIAMDGDLNCPHSSCTFWRFLKLDIHMLYIYIYTYIHVMD